MKCKPTGSLVATFLGTDNLTHPYNSIVYYISIYTCGYPRIKDVECNRQV